jgi:4-alpha-glucanotransferase
VTTHDLPTVAGVWTGRDLDAQRRLGLHPNDAASELLRTRLAERAGLDAAAPAEDAVRAAYQLLGRAPCAIVTATLDDALTVDERPNMPGTIDEWPNWRLALPAPLDSIEGNPLATDIAHRLQRVADRSSAPPDPG